MIGIARQWAGRLAGQLLGMALAGALLGCTTAPPAPGVRAIAAPTSDAAVRQVAALPAATAEPARYAINVGDELDLRFPDYAQHDQSVKVRPDGRISLPLVGSVAVVGRSPEDVQMDLAERYQALAAAAGERSYLIRPGDELEIKFPYQATLNETLKVRPDGKIALQLAGTVKAQGLSPEELQAELAKRYARVLRQPELVVIMRSFGTQSVRVEGGNATMGRAHAEYLRPVVMLKQGAPQQVFVGGEVQRPGVLVFKPGMTLLQAVVEAGGNTPAAEMRAVVVLRKVPGRDALVIRRDLAADLSPQASGPSTQDLVLEPADVVVLPQSSIASLGQTLDQYVFKLFPPLRNSAFSFLYDIRGRRY